MTQNEAILELKTLLTEAREKYSDTSTEVQSLKEKLAAIEQRIPGPAIFNESDVPSNSLYLDKKSLSKQFKNNSTLKTQLAKVISGVTTGQTEFDTKSVTTSNAGSYFLSNEISGQAILEALSKSRCVEAGTTVYPFDSPAVVFPKVTTATDVAAWKAEGSAHTEGTFTIGGVTLSPKTLFGSVTVSEELLADSKLVEQVVVEALMNRMAQKIDYAILMGAGNANDPMGIFYTENVNAYELASPGVVTRNVISDLVYKVESANHTCNGIIMSARERKGLLTLEETGGAVLAQHPYYANIPMFGTTGIPVNRAYGSPAAGTDGSLIFAGDWSKSVLGIRSNFALEFDKGGDNFNKYQINIRLVTRVAVAILDPTAFAVVGAVTD